MTSDKEMPAPQPDMCKGPSGFIIIFVGIITVFIMFNMELRMKLAGYIGVVLFPIIGFDFNGDGMGDIPILTLLFAGVILVSISSTIRHFQTDWVQMAKNQKEMKAINKALKEAKMGGDVEKERKITKYQQNMMIIQQQMMFTNMKMMVYTMLIAIAIFTWIWADFLERLDVQTISTPWNPTMQMMDRIKVCFIPFPKWILIYMLVSFPLGMVIQHSLKRYTFSKRLRVAQENERRETKILLEELHKSLGDLDGEVSFSLNTINEKLKKARDSYAKDEFEQAIEFARLGRGELEETRKAFYRTRRRIEDIEKSVEMAKKDGMNVDEMERKVEKAGNSLTSGLFKDALGRVHEVNNALKAEKKYFKKTLKEAKEIKSRLYDVRKISPDSFDENHELMEKNIKKGDYKGAMKKAREIRREVKGLLAVDKDYGKVKKKLKKLLTKAKSLDMKVNEELKEYKNCERSYETRDLNSAKKKVGDIYKELKKRVGQKERIQEAFSHTKLVLANARDCGVDISGPGSRYKEARTVFRSGDTDRALELLAQSVQEAERLKKQITRKRKRR